MFKFTRCSISSWSRQIRQQSSSHICRAMKKLNIDERLEETYRK